jgi:alpha-glucosidase
MLAFTRDLVAFRRASSALRLGAASVPAIEPPPGVLAFERRAEGERLLCLFDLGGAPTPVSIGEGWVARLRLPGTPDADASGRLTLPAFGGAIFGRDA